MDSTRLDCFGVQSESPETMRLVPRGEGGPISYNVAQTLNLMKSNLVKIFLSTANLTRQCTTSLLN